MNLYGHDYIAYKILNNFTPLIAAGSHLPDLVPYVPNSVFSFEEIHESPEIFFNFLKESYPEKTDIALSMMIHSVKFGVDKFNDVEKMVGLDPDYKDYLIRRIVEVAGTPLELAQRARVHNYLWVGADLYILQNYPEFISIFENNHKQIDRNECALLLSECFKKDYKEVLRMVNFLFDLIGHDSFESFEGYLTSWKRIFVNLNQGDNPDIQKSKVLFDEIYTHFLNRWPVIIESIELDVKRRLPII